MLVAGPRQTALAVVTVFVALLAGGAALATNAYVVAAFTTQAESCAEFGRPPDC